MTYLQNIKKIIVLIAIGLMCNAILVAEEYDFTLRTPREETLLKRTKYRILGPIQEEIDKIELIPDYFVALDVEPEMNNLMYIIVAMPSKDNDDGKGYIIEARLYFGQGVYEHYQMRTKSKFVIYKVFRDFYVNETLPNFGEWEDITEEI